MFYINFLTFIQCVSLQYLTKVWIKNHKIKVIARYSSKIINSNDTRTDSKMI